MLDYVRFVYYVLFVSFLEFLYFLQVGLEPFPLLNVVFNVFLDLALLNRKLFKLFFQKVGKLFFTAMMLVDEPLFDFTEHGIKLPDRLIVASNKLLFNKGELIGEIDEGFSFVVSFVDFGVDHFFG